MRARHAGCTSRPPEGSRELLDRGRPGGPCRGGTHPGGVTNPSLRDALVGLLGKPIADSIALCIPTAMYGHPMAGPGHR